MSKGARIGLSVLGVLAAPVMLAIVSGGALLNLLRENLKYRCGYYYEGDPQVGGYVCADGIGYILVGVFVYGCLGLLGLIAAVGAARLAGQPAARRRFLLLLALAPVALMLLTTGDAVASSTEPREPGADLWAEHMALAAWLAAASAALIAGAAIAPRRLAVALIAAALAALLATSVAQIGTLYGTLPAAILLAWASLVRETRTDPQPARDRLGSVFP